MGTLMQGGLGAGQQELGRMGLGGDL